MIATPMVIFAVLTVFDNWYTWYTVVSTPTVLTVFDDWYSVPIVKTAK